MADAGIIELFAAVEEGNAAKVKELIGKGISPNSFKDESRITPLHYCVQIGDVQMFKLLLENKASLRKRDCWMDSVVHYACRYGNINILELILKENSRPKKVNDQKGMTNLLNLTGKESKVPICEAILNKHISCVLMLFNEGAAIDIRDNTGKAPIDLLFDLPSELQNDMFDKLMTFDEKMEERSKFVLEIFRYNGFHQNNKIQEKTYKVLENFRQSDKEKWLEIFLQNDCVAEVKKLLEEPNYYTWNILQLVLQKAVDCNHEEIVRLVLNEQTGITADEDCIKRCVKNQSVRMLKYLLKFSKMEFIDTYKLIFLALETGNVYVVTVLFDQFLNPLDYVEEVADLWVKLIWNKYEIIRYLLNAAGKLDDKRIYHSINTPLMAEIESTNSTILKCIIAVISKPSDHQYFLQAAILTQNIEIVKLALTLHGSNLNAQEITRAAIQTKNSHFLELLIGMGLGLNYSDLKGWNALKIAVDTKEFSIVKLVYNYGVRMSKSKDEIWKAFEHNSKDILEFLLQRCSIVELCNQSSWSLLHEAVLQENLEIVRLLIKNMPHSEFNISGQKAGYKKHETPLALAVLRTNVEITKVLISGGADINKGGQNLFNAVLSGSEEMVSILLKTGISTNLDTQFGLTILHVAVIRNNVNIVKQMLQLKCIDINAKVDLSHTLENKFKQKYGFLYNEDISYGNIKSETTALQLAVRQNSQDLVQELLNHNADITIENKMGRLPWMAALIDCNNILMNILLQEYKSRALEIHVNALCKPDYKTRKQYISSNFFIDSFEKKNYNCTPLYFALSFGNLEAVNILLEHGASVSQVNSHGETALFGLTLLFNDRENVYQGVRILIEKGAKINHVNKDGSTVLNKAVEKGNHELVNALMLEGADVNSTKEETVEILLQTVSYTGHKYFCHMKIIHCLLQHGYNFKDLSKIGNWLLSVTSGKKHFSFKTNISKEQHIICDMLGHMKSLGFKKNVSKLLLTSVKYDLQILGKYLLSEGCDVNVCYTNIYSPDEKNALDLALEKWDFPLMKSLLDAGVTSINNKRLLNRFLQKVADTRSFQNRQYSTYRANTFSNEDLFLFDERYKADIANVINVFDIIIKHAISFEMVFALNDFMNSPIALSIKNKLPWAVEYFVGHKNVKDKLRSDAISICKLFDLLLQNFNFSTAKILVDNFGHELVQSNPTIVHKLLKLLMQRCNLTMYYYQDCGYVTEEEIINLTHWLIEKGLDINSRDEMGMTVLHHAAMCNAKDVVKFLAANQCDIKCRTYQDGPRNTNCTAMELAIHNCNFEIADFLLPCIYPNGIKNNKVEGLILDVINCEERKNNGHSKNKTMKELLKLITSVSSYENLLQSSVSKNDVPMVKILLEDRYKIYEENEKNMLSFLSKNLVNASKFHYIDIMEELIHAGAELRLQKGATALHYLCSIPHNHMCNGKCFKMLKSLIKEGTMTNIADKKGKYPLHHAIAYLNYDASKLLIEAGSLTAPYGPGSVSSLALYCSKLHDYQLYDGGQTERIALITRLLLKTGKGFIGNKVPPEVIHDVIVNERAEVLFLFSKYRAILEYNDSDGNTALHVACKHGSHQILAMLLDRECKVNLQNKEGKTPLLLACEGGKHDFIKLLLHHGAKADIPDNNGVTPIHMCIIIQLYEAVLLFLSRPCNVNKKTTYAYGTIKAGSTPLSTVLEANTDESQDIAEKLIDVGADVNICNEDGNSVLHIAVINKCKESFLRNLLRRCVYVVNTQNKEGSTPLLLACEQGKYDFVKLLLQHGAKSDVPDNNGITPIHKCIIKGLNQAVSLLLNKPCNVNKRTKSDHVSLKSGSTPLVSVLTMNSYTSQETAEKLIVMGADVNIGNEDGDTPIHIAVINGCTLSFLKNLLSRCLNLTVNSQNKEGSTPLLLACEQEKYEFIMLLVQHGAKPDVPDTNGITPIHMCVLKGLTKAVSLLLDKPCKVNQRTKYDYHTCSQHRSIKAGSTPLITALRMDYVESEIANQLFDVGADVNICNEEGDSPLHIAMSHIYKNSLLRKLLSKMLNIGIQNKNGWSILHIAVKNNNLKIVQLILKENCKVNAKINKTSEEFPGCTALHIAVHHTNVRLVEMLLKAGTSMFEMDVNGKTSMDLCDIAEKMTLWPILIKAGGSVKALVVNMFVLKGLQKSYLLDLLIESGCALYVQVQGHTLYESEESLLAEFFDKQQQPLSLTRLAANTVRTNIYPNALYNNRKLPLPEIVKAFICFDDLDVNQEVIFTESCSQQYETHLNVVMPYHAQHKTFAAADSDDSNDDYDDETVDGDSDDYDYCGSDDYIYDGTIDLNDINYGDDSDDGECVKDYGDNEDIDDADSDDSHTGDHEKDCNEDCVGVDDMDDDDPKDSDEDDCVEDYGDDDDAYDGDHYTVSDNEESEPHTNAPDCGVVYEYYDYYDCNIFDREFVCDENEYMYYD